MITNEIKAKIFAQYLGQNVMLCQNRPTEGLTELIFPLVGVKRESFMIQKDDWTFGQSRHFSDKYRDSLLLKPLSAITDEDIIWVAKYVNDEEEEDYSEAIAQKHFLIDVLLTKDRDESITEMTPIEILYIYQYLQSKGYALPYMDYSVEDLVKAGIYKLEE